MTHEQGWKLCLIAGMFPFSIGLYGYVTAFWMSTLLRPGEPFRVLWKVSSFSMESLAGFDAEAGAIFGVATLCFWQLLIVFGSTICTLSYFGVRRGERWAWWFLLAALLWGAGNDTAAAIYLHARGVMTIPTPLMVDMLGLTGLALSRDVLAARGNPRPA